MQIVNSSPANIKFSNTQLPKMIKSGEFLAVLLASVPQVIFQTGMVTLKKEASELPKKAAEYVKKGINTIHVT